MKSLIYPISLGLLLLMVGSLSACQTAPSADNTPEPAAPSASTETATTSTGHDATVNAGGQVVESGPYHLELVTAPEGEQTHLDFFLQKGDDHSAIADAKVTAQIQLPDGSTQSLPLTYDAAGEHYATRLASNDSGDYQIAVTAEVNGESVQGRFSFTR